jgi:hypothetical protein
MTLPEDYVVKVAIVTEIVTVKGEPGVYAVRMLFDGVPEVFHIELEGKKTSFKVREHSFYVYQKQCPTLKGLYALMRKWHRGERRELPVDLAGVDFI